MKVLFLYLTAFSTSGGIEKFNKAFMKTIGESEDIECNVISSHDGGSDSHYVSLNSFKGFSGNKILFSMEAVAEAGKYDIIILGHINLAPVGVLIKKIYSDKKLIVITHGIEVWNKLSGLKRELLECSDEIISVSNFTKNKLIVEQELDPNKIKILYNTIDPYFEKPISFDKPIHLTQQYGISPNDKIILTVCRLSSKEQYKGYDKIIEALPAVLERHPNLKYLLAGKSDIEERSRINSLIQKLSLENNVILTGFIPDSELTDHFKLADLFAMPSKGEGFGIVFLEAMFCGLPVICGNSDASPVILEKLPFGKSVDPDNINELSDAIIDILNENKFDKKSISNRAEEAFGFKIFKSRVMEEIVNYKKLLELEV